MAKPKPEPKKKEAKKPTKKARLESDNPTHREDFLRLLDAATKDRKEANQT